MGIIAPGIPKRSANRDDSVAVGGFAMLHSRVNISAVQYWTWNVCLVALFLFVIRLCHERKQKQNIVNFRSNYLYPNNFRISPSMRINQHNMYEKPSEVGCIRRGKMMSWCGTIKLLSGVAMHASQKPTLYTTPTNLFSRFAFIRRTSSSTTLYCTRNALTTCVSVCVCAWWLRPGYIYMRRVHLMPQAKSNRLLLDPTLRTHHARSDVARIPFVGQENVCGDLGFRFYLASSSFAVKMCWELRRFS